MYSIRFHLPILILTWLVVHSVLLWHYGIRTSLFDARVYVEEAAYLLEYGTLEDTYRIFYAVPIALLAVFRLLFAENIIPFLLFQCILSGMAAAALYQAAVNVFDNTRAGFFSAFIFLIWWDNIQWNTTTMTESLFQTFTCFVVYFLTLLKEGKRNYRMLILLQVVLILTRPTGIVIVISVLVSLTVDHLSVKRKPVIQTALIAGVLLVAGLVAGSLLHWDFTEEYRKGNIITYADQVEGTSLSYDIMRMDTSALGPVESSGSPIVNMISFIITNPVYIVKSGVLKIWFLISATRPYYSTLHNIYSIGWMTLIYALYFFGWKATTNQSIRLFSLTAIILNCLLVGVSSVDWDNRFYIPMAPGIILLAGGGAAWIRSFRFNV